jgi:tetraacyldisaccharide 4'-kinase
MMVEVWKGERPFLRGLLFPPLGFLAMLYLFVLTIRKCLYGVGLMRTALPVVPVISIGNMTLGGTGKTPVTGRLAVQLRERGRSPGIITRGYKRKAKGVFTVDPASATAEEVGDEAVMLARSTRVPVIVARERNRGIEKAVREAGIDIALFDDGYQVKNVRKDVDLLVVNGNEPRAAQRLFPLGLYREPLREMKRADAILINKGEPGVMLPDGAGGIPTFLVRYAPKSLVQVKTGVTSDWSAIRGKKVLAFSALGDNPSFFALLGQIGANVVKAIEFPDHHFYEPGDIRRIAFYRDIDMIVTTEKDAVKLERLDVPDNLFYLSIEAEIENEHALIELVLDRARR